MSDASDFWAPYEFEIAGIESFQSFTQWLMDRWLEEPSRPRRFAWRGVCDARWPLYSSLYRRVREEPGAPGDEKRLALHEGALLRNFQRWGLDHGDRGRLSSMAQLAVMQHHGVPTRLIDISFSAHVALWFAVEERQGVQGALNDVDGRIFAIDIADRLVNERRWGYRFGDERDLPWLPRTSHESPLPDELSSQWSAAAFAWRPPPLDRRITAQHGGFLLGGVPEVTVHWGTVTTDQADGDVDRRPTEELRSYTSLALRVHKAFTKKGRPPAQPFYTARIKASAKEPLRRHLEEFYGYSHTTMYPDYEGFSDFTRQRPLPVD